MATNLTNPELVFASNQALISARAELAKVKLFSTNFSADAAQPGETMKVPIFLAGAAQAFNKATSNYETSNGTVWWVPMTFKTHLHSTWEFNDKDTLATNIDLWRNAGIASGEAIVQGIVENIMSVINKTTIPTSGTDPNAVDADGTPLANAPTFSAHNEVVFAGAAGNTLKKQVAKLRATAQKVGIKPRRSVLVVNSDMFAELLDLLDSNVYGGAEAVRNGIIPNLYGWKAIMECNEFPTAAGENLVGAVIQEDCLAIAGRQIVPGSPSCYDEVGTTTDPDSGLVLTTRKHGKPGTGDTFATIEALFGYKLLQPSKVIRLVSAATATAGGEDAE